MKIVRSLLITIMLLAVGPFAQAMEPVDINQADAVTLARVISGIGVKKAQAVIAYREQHGLFQSVEELANVKGIGPKTIEKNREILTIGEPTH